MIDNTGLHRFLKYNAVDQYMLSWVVCYQKMFPAVSIERAISLFNAHFQINEKDVKLLSQKRKFLRMQEDFHSYLRHESQTAASTGNMDPKTSESTTGES